MIYELNLEEIKAKPYPAIRSEAIDALMERAPEWLTRAMLDEYHSHWVLDEPGCGSPWFTWGVVHGAGFCGRCSWPGRLYHFIRDPDSGAEWRWEGLLWAHPREVER